jgi:hypothetical protein
LTTPLTAGGLPVEYYLEGSPTGFYRVNFSRFAGASDSAALTTQVMTTVAVYLTSGETVTNITFKSGATAAGTPTNWWFALYDTAATSALIAQSADQTTAAWAADTSKTLALSTPYRVTTSGIHYAAVMVKATTPPTLVGATLGRAGVSSGLITGEKILAQTSGSSLTTTAPSTIASPAGIAAVPLVVLT